MRLPFDTEQAAQTRADQIYADLAALNALEPGTLRWAVPYKEGSTWYVTVDERCRGVLTPEEVATFPEWQEVAL